ncbi:Hypothetical protein SMAX5B_013166, partial [Scophthalmus maximus]
RDRDAPIEPELIEFGGRRSDGGKGKGARAPAGVKMMNLPLGAEGLIQQSM